MLSMTPGIFSQSSKYLGGTVAYTDLTYVIPGNIGDSNYSLSFFTMGFGYAYALPGDETLGFSIDVSLLYGLSFPVDN
jgi:hypothetical protein